MLRSYNLRKHTEAKTSVDTCICTLMYTIFTVSEVSLVPIRHEKYLTLKSKSQTMSQKKKNLSKAVIWNILSI